MKTPQTETAAKKDVLKLQRAIVDGLEDVKAQDIQVFNTEQLSPLFERVIIASGTSNRQTKALASSVRDAVREAGFDKPRIEGEENGEWIIVDCGPAVAHIMQPAIRQYYHLEDLWGETPVRLKLGATKPAAASSADQPAKVSKPTRKKAVAGADAGAGTEKPRRAPRAASKSDESDTPATTAQRAAPRKRSTTATAGDAKPSTPRKTTARKAASSTAERTGSDGSAGKVPAKKATAVRVTKVKPAVGAASAARNAAVKASKPAATVRKKAPAKRAG
jgi:ribosome-associated protein